MDINNVQNHVQTRAESPSKQPKQTQPNNHGGVQAPNGWRNNSSIDQYFIRFKPMQETSNLSPLRMNRSEAGTNPYPDKPYQDPHSKPISNTLSLATIM